MIDIHHHCVPEVDDGARNLAEAVEMCRMAWADGIQTVVATPHMLRGRWKPVTADELQTRLDTLRSHVGNAPRLELGAECFFTHDLGQALQTRSAIPLAGSRYVLIEFATDNVPPHVDRALHELQLAQWIPIVAHPERNSEFRSNPDLLSALVSAGARTQITAGSLLGQFGSAPRRVSATWIRQGLVHFVASDGHNVRNRVPLMSEAAERIRKIAGGEVAEFLTVGNPLAVIERRALPFVPTPELRPDSGFLARLMSFIEVRR